MSLILNGTPVTVPLPLPLILAEASPDPVLLAPGLRGADGVNGGPIPAGGTDGDAIVNDGTGPIWVGLQPANGARAVGQGEVVLRPEDAAFGGVGDGVVNDTAAVIACFTAAAGFKRVDPVYGANVYAPGATVLLTGTYKLTTLSGPVVATCNVDGTQGTFVVPTAYADTAVLVGTATSGEVLHGARIVLPNIRKTLSVSTLTAGSIGYQVQNLHHSQLVARRVTHFETGAWFTGYNQGTVHNVVDIGWIDLCKVSVKMTPRTGGWVNQNTFIGGGVTQSPNTLNGGSTGDIRRTGWRHLLIDGTGGNGTINANTFTGVSYEGDLSEYFFEVRYASHNIWNGATRFEQGTVAVATTLSSPTFTTTAHGMAVGDMVVIFATSTRPDGMTSGDPYWVATVPNANTFTLAETRGGTTITFGSNGSGLVFYKPPRVLFDGTGGFTFANEIKPGYYSWPGPLDIRRTAAPVGNRIAPSVESLGDLMPGRNRVVNGDFRINQRGYASGATLAGDQYGFDRWKATTAGTTLTFTAAPQGQPVTLLASKGIVQVLERANVEPGTYTLSWRGLAWARVYNDGASAPTGAISPLTVEIDGTANVRVEFLTPGAVNSWIADVQFERGDVATPFERVPMGVATAQCQRYFVRYGAPSGATVREPVCMATAFSTTAGWGMVQFPVAMRVAPTLTLTGTDVRLVTNGAVNYSSTVVAAPVFTRSARLTITSSALTAGHCQLVDTGDSNALLDFSAEL